MLESMPGLMNTWSAATAMAACAMSLATRDLAT